MSVDAARTRERVTFAILGVGVGTWALLQSLILPVIPTIERALHTNQTDVTWLFTANLLSTAIFTPILGRLADIHGKARVLIAGLVALTLGSLLAALAPSLALMVVARSIQGIGGGILPVAFGIVRDEFAVERAGAAIGGLSSIASLAVGVGVVVAGPITDALGYRWLFWLPLMLTAATTVAACVFVPRRRGGRGEGAINWGAALLLAGWLGAGLLAVSEGSTWGWGSIRVVTLFLIVAAFVPLWVRVESRARNPLVDLRTMRLRPVWTCNAISVLLGSGLYSVVAFVPAFVQAPASSGYGLGASVTQSGLILLPMMVGSFLLGIAASTLDTRIGPKRLLIAACAGVVIGFVVLALANSSTIDICVAMVIVGSGVGLAFAGMANLVVRTVPSAQTGIATGLNTNLRTVGGAVGVAVVASIVASSTSSAGLPKEVGYSHGFLVLAAIALFATAVAFLVPSPQRDATSVQSARVLVPAPDEVR